jgi:hypothetical protein
MGATEKNVIAGFLAKVIFDRVSRPIEAYFT